MIARPRLRVCKTLSNVFAPLSLLEEAKITVVSFDMDGVRSEESFPISKAELGAVSYSCSGSAKFAEHELVRSFSVIHRLSALEIKMSAKIFGKDLEGEGPFSFSITISRR